MLIGIIGLGMLFGLFAGAGAMIAGQSFLTALLIYASVGTIFALGAIMSAAAVSVFHRYSPREKAHSS